MSEIFEKKVETGYCSQIFKKLSFFLFGLQIRTNHGRTIFEIIQNGGINHDGGFGSPLFEKFPKINDYFFPFFQRL
jgi:hypothetical protein